MFTTHATYFVSFLCRVIPFKGLSVLELGAGSGLLSIMCGLKGSSRVCCTDYDSFSDHSLMEVIEGNLNRYFPDNPSIGAVGHVWGNDVTPLLTFGIQENEEENEEGKYDLVFLCDLIFNRSEHQKLLNTCYRTVKPHGKGVCHVIFSHHDPQYTEKDLNFFELAEKQGFIVTKGEEVEMEDLFVENDGMDHLRNIVYFYTLTLP